MTLQVLPPEMLEAPKEKIETKEPQPYFKPSSLKDGESEEFRLLGCYETGHAVVGWQYASEKAGPDGELKFAGYVVTRTHPGSPSDIARETDWAKPDRPKIDGTSVKPRTLPCLGSYVSCSWSIGSIYSLNKNLFVNNLLKSSKKLKTTLGLKMDLLTFRLRLVVREPVWKLHTAFFQKLEKYQRKSLASGHPKRIQSGYLTSLKVKILLMGSKLTRKVFQLVEPTNAEPT